MESLPTLLIVDDIPDNLAYIEAVVSSIKLNLIKATSGEEALEKVKGLELTLAILDIQMPYMDGYELALKLNEERLSEKIPIIFLTAHYLTQENVIKGFSVGAVDYISKPINNNILLSKIKVFIDLFTQKQTIFRNLVELQESADKLTQANNLIQKSEQKFRSYIENAPDGIFITDETGRYIEVNEAASKITGYSKDDLLKLSIQDILVEESQNEGMIHFRKLINDGIAKSELLFKHKNGSTRWESVDAVKLSETRFLRFAKDITDRKKVEEELKNSLSQLHHLTQHIEKVREEERVSISRDLHDDLGQALTSVKIDLGMISRKVTDAEVITKLNKTSAVVSDMIKTVQRLTSELRPQIIDDLGLEAAIGWYSNEFSQRNEVDVLLDMDPDISMTSGVSLLIFRIMQESLTNIARHSKATQVNISLSKTDDFIDFRITDNGVGITEEQKNAKNAFGIMGMTERANSLGGTLSINGEVGKGTMIQLILPVK